MKNIIIALILASGTLAANSTAPTSNVLQSAGGRFVFGQINMVRADQYMLDTETGRLWALVLDSEGNKTLEPVLYYRTVLNTPMRDILPQSDKSLKEHEENVDWALENFKSEAYKETLQDQ